MTRPRAHEGNGTSVSTTSSADLADGVSVGKHTLIEGASTTSLYVNEGATCDGESHVGACFLDEKARGRLIDEIKHRSRTAEESYRLACAALEVDALLEKEAELPLHVALMIDVISLLVGDAVTSALSHLREAGKAAFARLGVELLGAEAGKPNFATAAFNALGGVSDRHISESVKRTVDLVKKQVSGDLTAVGRRHGRNAREVKLAYLRELDRAAIIAFQSIREETTARADDSELVALFEGFHAKYHTKDRYQAELADKVARYRTGPARIGLHRMGDDERHLHKADPRRVNPEESSRALPDYVGGGFRERKLVRVVYASGHPGHLGYAHLDWQSDLNIEPTLEMRRPNITVLSGCQVILPAALADEESTTGGIQYYGGAVPAEFEEVALARHAHVYGSDPEPFLILEHEWPQVFGGDPERMRRSLANLRQATELIAARHLPRFDLGSFQTTEVRARRAQPASDE